jgi:DNA-binding Xre family transcriptional regulator
MKKTDLIPAANISTTTLARLSKNQVVRMDVMARICKTLNCDIGDIMEMLPDNQDDEQIVARKNN